MTKNTYPYPWQFRAYTSLQAEIEYLTGILALGMLELLRHDITQLNHVENILFNPGILAQLQSLDLNPALHDVVAQGLEIEDIQSLLPEQLDAYIGTLKKQTLKLLGSLPVQSDNGLRLQLHIRHSDTRLPIDYPLPSNTTCHRQSPPCNVRCSNALSLP